MPENGPSVNHELIIPRRVLLSSLALLAGGLALDAIPHSSAHANSDPTLRSPKFKRRFWSNASTFKDPNPTREDLEQRFGVTIVSSMSELNFEHFAAPKAVEPWDGVSLAFLGRVLQNIPDSFYQPQIVKGEINKLKIAIANSDGPIEDKSPASMIPIFQTLGFGEETTVLKAEGLVYFEKEYLKEPLLSDPETEIIAVHEFAHNGTIWRMKELIGNICEPIGLGKEFQIQDIFYSRALRQDRAALAALPKIEQRLQHAGTNFEEFIAVACEFYYQGREKFMEAYHTKLGEERAVMLHEGVRREIFEKAK